MPTVSFGELEYPIAAGETLLDALVRGGANVPFSCRKGSCHTCLMQLRDGDAGPSATKGLAQALVDERLFLPCLSHPPGNVSVALPDLSKLYCDAVVSKKEWLSKSVCKLSFEPATNIDWRPGQFIVIRRDDGVARSYSIASIKEEDYLLSIHVKRVENGLMSNWLLDDVGVNDVVRLRGPGGGCFYDPQDPERDILMLGEGSGLAPLFGVVRDALRQGHRGSISLFHGARDLDGLYLRSELRELAAAHSNFSYRPCLSTDAADIERGNVVELAFGDGADRAGTNVFLCGAPDMVQTARVAAVAAGVRRPDIRADPFEHSHGQAPKDREKIAVLKPRPELWRELDQGPGLSTILKMFYDIAYEDSRLAPFFHKITKERAIQQQYSFLSDLITGARGYFGLRPFNAHHWMVISDELFDYREELMEQCMRAHGLSEAAVRSWGALHEVFRQEIVKSTARGQIIDGEEHPLRPPEQLVTDFAGMCDGCAAEMPVGTNATFIPRTGRLFCAACGIRHQTTSTAAAAR